MSECQELINLLEAQEVLISEQAKTIIRLAKELHEKENFINQMLVYK